MRTILIAILLLLPLITKEGGSNSDGVFNDYLYSGFNQFKSIMSFRESSNNPKSEARKYYRGLYHIGKSAAKDIKVPFDSLFIPKWSDTALIRYMKYNWKLLSDCQHYVGDTITGIVITKAGMLAGAHLKGHVYVRSFLRSGGRITLTNRRGKKLNGKDLNGVSVREYMILMQDVIIIKY